MTFTWQIFFFSIFSKLFLKKKNRKSKWVIQIVVPLLLSKSFVYYHIVKFAVQLHYNASHYDAVFNITRSFCGSQTGL